MRLFNKLRRKLDYLDESQINQIEQAYFLALAAHKGQKRHTGEPYITHPVAVACLLADMRLDAQTIMAALLHDVIEDTSIEKTTLAEKFGEVVAELVDGVSKLTQIEFVSRAEAQAENFGKMLLAMSRDIRVIIIKLADRLHNMRTLSSLPPDKRKRVAQETLDIFAPMAKRLGMRDLSVELEELSFMLRYPKRYAALRQAVQKAREERKKVLLLVTKTLEEGLAKSHLPTCILLGREKHLYSIYRKMHKKHLPFNEIMDVYAFRIIVDDIDTCYRVLGLVHQLFKPVPEKFKDYIAIPKSNGYQSLHTVLTGPYGYPIEVQIRTTEMDHRATSGIAAHWLYKTIDNATDPAQVRAQQWVKNLLEMQRNTGSSLEFLEDVKLDLFPDEVYVFTPRGKIMRFPAGATVVDFAYAVHTDIGNTCVSAKMNRQLSPLSAPLISGQTVEIITNSHAHPNPAWLDFAVTRQARHGIRQFLKNQHKDASIALGEKLLKQALQQHELVLRKIPPEATVIILKETQLSSLIDLFIQIGLGHRPAALVAKRLADLSHQTLSPEMGLAKSDLPLAIKGTEGMAISFAECCYPIPGDPIVGIFSSGEGIVVHCEQCSKIDKLRRYPESYMPLRWDENVNQIFLVSIHVEAIDQARLLAKMAAAISDSESNIEDVRVKSQGGQYYQLVFKLTVRNRKHLARVIRQLRRIPAVSRITRPK